ncbi:MAG: hypothetical protein WCX31_19080 [Salinivirgaceae bacterium]|jgi:hypothetical protein
MEYLVKDLIERLINKKKQELLKIKIYKKEDLKDMILISSGRIFELDAIIQEINEMLVYKTQIK